MGAAFDGGCGKGWQGRGSQAAGPSSPAGHSRSRDGVGSVAQPARHETGEAIAALFPLHAVVLQRIALSSVCSGYVRR